MVERPSILFVNRVVPPQHGASGLVLADLAARLAARGCRVTVVADGPPTASCPLTAAGVRVVRSGRGGGRPGPIGYLVAWLRLAVLALRQPRHGHVVTMTDPPLLAMLGPILALRHGAPVHWCQDLYPDMFEVAGRRLHPWLSGFLEGLSVWALRRHRRTIAIGACMARRLIDRGLPPSCIQVIPNAAPVIPPIAESVQSPSGRPTLLYAGTVGLAHPVEGMIDALAAAARAVPGLRVVLAVHGRRFRDVAAAAASGRLPATTVLFPQPAAAFHDLASRCDIHLALQDVRAAGAHVPLKIAAALAHGRPVILLGPRQGHAAALLSTGAGWVVPPDDAEAFARLVKSLADDPAQVAAAARIAAQIGRRWTSEHVLDAFLDVIGGIQPQQGAVLGIADAR